MRAAVPAAPEAVGSDRSGPANRGQGQVRVGRDPVAGWAVPGSGRGLSWCFTPLIASGRVVGRVVLARMTRVWLAAHDDGAGGMGSDVTADGTEEHADEGAVPAAAHHQ